MHLESHPSVGWALFSEKEGEPSAIPVGTTAADLPGGSRRRPYTNGKSFVTRVLPEQHPYSARNIVRLRPKSTPAHNCLGVTLGRKGDVQAALEETRTVLTLDPNNANYKKSYDALAQRANK